MKIEVRKLQNTDIEELSRIEAASFSMPWLAELQRPFDERLLPVCRGGGRRSYRGLRRADGQFS